MNTLTIRRIATTATRPAIITQDAAAAQLGMSPHGVKKLIKCGILPHPITQQSVDQLRDRDWLEVTSGQVMVLRTDGPSVPASSNDGRSTVGYHDTMDDATLTAASLRYWRCDPDRAIGNLLLVTVSTVVCAVYLLDGLDPANPPIGTGTETRYAFTGTLLARRGDTPGRITGRCGGPAGLSIDVATLMDCRVKSTSGGPIAYLPPDN